METVVEEVHRPTLRPGDDDSFRKRVQLEFGREGYEHLVAIKEQAGASSFSKVIRQALVLLDWYFQCRARGVKLGVQVADGTFVPAPDLDRLI